VLDVMNDAPRGTTQMDDQHVTVEHLREAEQQMHATSVERWSIFAKHGATGQLVGLTDVTWSPSLPETVNQGNTGVRAEHRGHALGKWMKAAMLRRILDERPQCKDVRTGNADSNEAMLGINHALGFKPYIATTNWQVPVDRVNQYLRG
jgi:RimJ/RimL family protein N-acetyltransferase